MIDFIFNIYSVAENNNLSHRPVLAIFLAFILAIIFGKIFIAHFKKLQQFAQPIRSYIPENHLLKSGTPTMGGVIIILSTLCTTLLIADLNNNYIWLLLLILVGFGLIGFIDDYKKILQKDHQGISPRRKLFLQLSLGLIVILLTKHYFPQNLDYHLSIPFFKGYYINLSYLYIPFALLVITGSSNAVNLTDGLDGLAAGTSIIAILTFAIIAYITGNNITSSFYKVKYLELTQEIVVFCSALAGALLGFLWFNTKPAQVFMGDTGSLALGGTIGFISIILQQELLLVLIGAVFVIETLSVILQVAYFKKTGGKRLFLMAPIHHHFEKKGYKEEKIIIRFWILSFFCSVAALYYFSF